MKNLFKIFVEAIVSDVQAMDKTVNFRMLVMGAVIGHLMKAGMSDGVAKQAAEMLFAAGAGVYDVLAVRIKTWWKSSNPDPTKAPAP